MKNDYERKVIIHKAITDKTHFYFPTNVEAFSEVVKKLHTTGAIKLFFYLAKNQNNYDLTLNEDEFCNWANEDKKSFDRGFKELIENNYLIENLDSEGNSYNLYNFYDYNPERIDLQIIDNGKNKNNKYNSNINMTVYDIRINT